MKTAKTILIYLATFIAGSLLAIFHEGLFHQLVRQLYSSLTYNQITFQRQKLDLYFTYLEFGISFGLFLIILLALLSRQSRRQVLINLLLTFVFMTSSLLLYCFFDANIK